MNEKEEHWQDENIMKARAEAASAAEAVGTMEFAGEKARKPSLIYLAVKRTVDVVGSLVGLILCSPVFLVVAVAIKREDGGPILHRRYCAGRNDREYIMYKFRSMKVNADNMLDMFTEEQREQYLSGVKLEDDPRITKVGKFIRATSIDELPQLISVLKGDMSIIGPRPVIEREAQAYGADREKLLSVRSGITGVWQVEGRGEVPFLSEEAKQMQLSYIDKRGFVYDCQLLFKTIGLVLKRKGAR
ncbi:MAG: sugar transferase [Clostridiales bacterium]|nr:sugar transferase [Clostridiales bacterium]